MNYSTHKSRPSQIAFYAALATTLLAFLRTAPNAIAQISPQDNPNAVLDEAWQAVDQQFVDRHFNGVDWQAVRQDLLNHTYTSREAAYTALRQELKRLDDPYTRFLDPQEYQAFGTQVYGEVSGVGVRLQTNAAQQLVVSETMPDTPASQAGIQTGDRVVAIDEQPTAGMNLEEASGRIRGGVGTTVTLSIQRHDQPAFDVPLTRVRIEIASVHATVKQESGSRIGYIRLDVFSSHSAEQMQQAIQGLLAQHVTAFVLDLRDNPGGEKQAAIDIARMWLNSGAIVRTVDRDGNSEEAVANHTALTQLPLAVLVNGNSASASEILTGALMDNHRAVTVGTRTFGKALVQLIQPLSDGSALTVTVAHYYTPNGTDISHRGITPNIVANVTDAEQQQLAANQALRGAASDSQYRQAITSLQASIKSVQAG